MGYVRTPILSLGESPILPVDYRQQDPRCTTLGGKCRDVTMPNNVSSGYNVIAGKCPGNSDIKCFVPLPASAQPNTNSPASQPRPGSDSTAIDAAMTTALNIGTEQSLADGTAATLKTVGIIAAGLAVAGLGFYFYKKSKKAELAANRRRNQSRRKNCHVGQRVIYNTVGGWRTPATIVETVPGERYVVIQTASGERRSAWPDELYEETGKVLLRYAKNSFGSRRRHYQDPGGKSALRAAGRFNQRNLPCPTCKQPDRLTPADVRQGYQCNECADREEGAC